MNQDLEIRRVVPDLERLLADFFHTLAQAREERFFAPHPLTPEQASVVAHYPGRDFYAVALYQGRVVGYGMLRGWDEGYDVPSLGISVHPEFRGIGLGVTLMRYLHAVAALRGCRRMRVRVRQDNRPARHLYETLGYHFEPGNDEYAVGFLQLKPWSAPRHQES